MELHKRVLIFSAVTVAASLSALGQYTPPPPPAPFASFINEALRKDDPVMKAWDIGGQERFRFEDHEGYGVPGVPGLPPKPNNDFRDRGADVANAYWLSRLRLHLGYTNTWWGAFVEGESSLAAEDERYAYFANPAPQGTRNRRGAGPESDEIDLHQAYFTVGNSKEFPLSLKIGRQELSYGEERLVGAFGWNNIGRTFDAVKLRWQNEWFAADVFTSHIVIPEDGRFDVFNDHELFSGLYATSAKIPKNTLDFYFFARNASRKAINDEPSPQFPQPSARDIYTIGGRLKSKPGELGNWDYLLDGAYQFGNFLDTRAGAPTQRLKQDAYMFVALGGYTFAGVWAEPRLGLEFDYGSGDSDAKDGTHGTFDNLFPTNHKFYGSMDLVSLQNVQDLGVSLTLQPHKRVRIAFVGNALWLADTHDSFYTVAGVPRGGVAATPGNGFGVNPKYSDYLGSEFTMIAGWAVTRFLQLEGGYGHFFHGDYISQSWSAPSLGARDADFVYLQMTMNF